MKERSVRVEEILPSSNRAETKPVSWGPRGNGDKIVGNLRRKVPSCSYKDFRCIVVK